MQAKAAEERRMRETRERHYNHERSAAIRRQQEEVRKKREEEQVRRLRGCEEHLHRPNSVLRTAASSYMPSRTDEHSPNAAIVFVRCASNGARYETVELLEARTSALPHICSFASHASVVIGLLISPRLQRGPEELVVP